MNYQKNKGKAASVPGGLAFGVTISLALTGGMAAIFSKCLEQEILSFDSLGYGVMIMLLVASYAGAVGAYHKIKRQRVVICLMNGAMYFAVLLALTAILFGGQYQAVLVTLGLVFAGSMSAGILDFSSISSRKKRKAGIVYR